MLFFFGIDRIMPIPKIIHQTYSSRDLPKTYSQCQSRMIDLHPDFEYIFYDDDAMYSFIELNFGEYYSKFRALPRKIMRVDMFRQFIMYKVGGLQADLDYYMIKKFDMLDEALVLPCSRVDNRDNITRIGNFLIASEPGHPFWLFVINTLFEYDRCAIDFSINSVITDSELSTGPAFITSMWKKFDFGSGKLTVAPKHFFSPNIVIINDENVNRLRQEGTYGVHLCTGLWRR